MLLKNTSQKDKISVKKVLETQLYLNEKTIIKLFALKE